METDNLILRTDSYKSSQWKQYPPLSNYLFSYFESRGGVYPSTITFGLQYYLKKYLQKPITIENVKQAAAFMKMHGLDFNESDWSYIVQNYDGKLPVRIRAVPEGLNIPVSNILMSIECADPRCFWVVNWLETMLVKVWYPTTVATQSFYLKKRIYDSLVRTADDPDSEIDFKLHSFGYRGVSSEESAAIGGAAELTSFKGTDTINGILAVLDYYKPAKPDDMSYEDYYCVNMPGFSINASEHSTITSWGRGNELEAYRNMLKQFGRPGSVFACVSDSYDIYNAIENLWGDELKEDIIKSGGTVVIRPDSGQPLEVVPKCLHFMEKRFGAKTNSKGYKVLNNVRLIQGDGVNPTSIKEILDKVNEEGFSTSNIAFGMGGASLQGSAANTINRDTQKFAFKASAIGIGDSIRDVYKDPITDSGKRSKRGRLDMIRENEEYKTIKVLNVQDVYAFDSIMRTVYENGRVCVDEDIDVIRARVQSSLKSGK